MARYGMVIDTRQCVGCMDCVVACKTENDVPDGFCRDWITSASRERCRTCGSPSAPSAATTATTRPA